MGHLYLAPIAANIIEETERMYVLKDREECCKILSSGHDMAIAIMNSQ